MSDCGGIFEAALAHHQSGRLAEAEALYAQVLNREPEHIEALHFLGVLWFSAGHADRAIPLIARAVELAPTLADAHAHLGLALKAAGRLAEARTSLATAIRLDPNSAANHNNCGVVLRAERDHRAAQCFRAALALDPGFAEAHNNLGNSEQDRGSLGGAIACLSRATTLRPSYADAQTNLGNALAASGALTAAVAAYMRALEHKPNQADILHNLGVALLALNRIEAAFMCLRREAAWKPEEAGPWGSLGAVEKARGRVGKAILCFRRAIAIVRGDASASNSLADAYQALGDVALAARWFRRAIELRPENQETNSNLLFCLCYDPAVDADALFAETRHWESRHAIPRYPRSASFANDPVPERPLRIGYLSADFRDHPVGRNVIGVLEHHDRRAFKLNCYAELRAAGDAASDRFTRLAQLWRPTTGLSDEAVAASIRADGVDVLVVLAGHTGHNRLGVAAYRPAPVQVSYHDLTTSGLAVMDAWLTDPVLHPLDTTERFTETLVRLPCFYLHRPPDPSPTLSPPPSLASSRVTFGSCNNPAKLSLPVIETWSAILRAVPGSRLLLKYVDWFGDPAVVARFTALFAHHGIGSDRLEFVGGDLRRAEQLAILERVDIALDPFPFNGSTTTFEALWMGAPVVSLAGERFVGRVGASVLMQLGLADHVAATTADYVRIACTLAGDPARLATLRGELRRRLLASALCDAPAHARAIEAAYRELWRGWCARAAAAKSSL